MFIIQTEKWFELESVENNIKYNAKIHINITKSSIETKQKTPQKFNNNLPNTGNISNYQSINTFETKSPENSPRLLLVNNKLTAKTSKISKTPATFNANNFMSETNESSSLIKSIAGLTVIFAKKISESYFYIQSVKSSPKSNLPTNIKILTKYPELKLNLQKAIKHSGEEERSSASQTHRTKRSSNESYNTKGIHLLEMQLK